MSSNFSNKEQNKSKKCFIITPIGGKRTKIREMCTATIEKAIRPALKDLGFMESNIYASHQDYTPGDIDAKIVSDIIEADVVIANVTHNNANVLYELAIRHFIGKPVVTISSEDTVPAFDISHQRLIQFESIEDDDMENLKNDIQSAVKILDKFQPNNIIYRTAIGLGYNMKDLTSSVEFNSFTLSLFMYPSAQSAVSVDEAEKTISTYLENYNDFSKKNIKYRIQRISNESIAIFSKYTSQSEMAGGKESMYHLSASIGWGVRE